MNASKSTHIMNVIAVILLLAWCTLGDCGVTDRHDHQTADSTGNILTVLSRLFLPQVYGLRSEHKSNTDAADDKIRMKRTAIPQSSPVPLVIIGLIPSMLLTGGALSVPTQPDGSSIAPSASQVAIEHGTTSTRSSNARPDNDVADILANIARKNALFSPDNQTEVISAQPGEDDTALRSTVFSPSQQQEDLADLHNLYGALRLTRTGQVPHVSDEHEVEKQKVNDPTHQTQTAPTQNAAQNPGGTVIGPFYIRPLISQPFLAIFSMLPLTTSRNNNNNNINNNSNSV